VEEPRASSTPNVGVVVVVVGAAGLSNELLFYIIETGFDFDFGLQGARCSGFEQ
jgi:hypothetical protein